MKRCSSRISVVAALVMVSVGSSQAQDQISDEQSAQCYASYLQANIVFDEDFSLRLYQSGNSLTLDQRMDIESEQIDAQLDGTLCADMDFMACDAALNDAVAQCDALFNIPEKSVATRIDDEECAIRYATLMHSAKNPEEKSGYAARARKAVEMANFIMHWDPAEYENGAEEMQKYNAKISSKALERAKAIFPEGEEPRYSDLAAAFVDAQSCDAKYDFPVIAMPEQVRLKALGR